MRELSPSREIDGWKQFDLSGMAPEHPVVALCSILVQRGYLDDIEFVEPGIDFEAKEQPGTISVFLKGCAWEEVSRIMEELRRQHSVEWNILMQSVSTPLVPLVENTGKLRNELLKIDPAIIPPELRPKIEALYLLRGLRLIEKYQEVHPRSNDYYQSQINEAQAGLRQLGVEPITPFEVEAIVERILDKFRVVL